MSFLKRLFGSGREEPVASTPVEYKGWTIAPAPFREGGQFQTAGIIRKEINGVVKEHRFIRADRFTSAEEAVNHAVRKARQIIDERGERLFESD
jgi:hypothetical protein